MTKNLVEQAKELKSKRRTNYEITPDVIELALAWQRDEIAIGQIKKVLNIAEPNKIYAILARALKANAKPKEETKMPSPKAVQKYVEDAMNTKKPTKTIGKSPDEAPSKY